MPAFFWEQYGFWCFAGHAQVSALLRDRRFGQQILHLASRQQLGWSEPPAHLGPFLDVESHSLLELEPPEHTRLRNAHQPGLRVAAGRAPRAAHRRTGQRNDRRFRGTRRDRSDRAFRDADPGRRHRRTARRAPRNGAAAARLVAPHGRDVSVRAHRRDRTARGGGGAANSSRSCAAMSSSARGRPDRRSHQPAHRRRIRRRPPDRGRADRHLHPGAERGPRGHRSCASATA